ncbi:MAG: ATP-binding protein [Candidatus Odinarchaeota archaeon]
MTENNNKIYYDLQFHLDKMPIGFPKADSGVEIRVLKDFFTPEEAYIATKLDFLPQKIKRIHHKMKNRDISLQYVENKLLQMYRKGTINMGEENGEKTYANAPIVVGMYEYQLGRLTPDFVKNAFQYFDEAFFEKEYNKTGIPQLRTIPIEKAITNDLAAATYDQIRNFIDKSNTIGIMDCICRKAHDLLGNPCKKTTLRETCMVFGSAARRFNEMGEARFISREEAISLIEKFETIGLVPSPSNSQKPFVICNCCGCCCEVIGNQKKFDNPAQYFASNFYAKINLDDCIGCGVCEERCQMNAISLVDEKSNIDLGKCIGCGVCVPTCPENAIELKKKEQEIIPPIDTRATYVKIMNEKAKLAQTKKN